MRRTPDPCKADYFKTYGKERPLIIKTAKKYCEHISSVAYMTGGNVDVKDRNVLIKFTSESLQNYSGKVKSCLGVLKSTTHFPKIE